MEHLNDTTTFNGDLFNSPELRMNDFIGDLLHESTQYFDEQPEVNDTIGNSSSGEVSLFL